MTEPFLKWAGCKRGAIAEQVIAHFPSQYNTYYEPFLGAGGVFLALNPERAVLSDINKELINVWQHVQSEVPMLCVEIRDLWAEGTTKEDYYRERHLYNKNKYILSSAMDRIVQSARFIYLNRTGYRGLYRVNKNGIFNVPFGDYKKPKPPSCDEFSVISTMVKYAEVLHCSFTEIIGKKPVPRAGDLVYCDPPYIPESKTSSFTGYAGKFGLSEQIELRDRCAELIRQGVYVVVSNSDTKETRELYAGEEFEIVEVLARRLISSKGDRTKKHRELLIKPSRKYREGFNAIN